MTRKRHIYFLKYFSYVLLLVVLYTLQTTPRLFEIFGTKPNLLVPAAVCIAMFEGDLAGGLLGAFAGLLCDLGSYTLFGFNGLLLCAGCVLAALLTIYLTQLKLHNALLLGGAILLLRGILDYFFYFSIWGYEKSWLLLVKSILPCAIYSACTIPLFYWVVNRMKLFFDAKLKI